MPWKNINFKGILFDLDGTLIDSMEMHNKAWIEILSENNHTMTDEILTEYTGVPNFKTVQIFNDRFGWKLDPLKISSQKEDRFLEKLKEIKLIDITVQVVKENFGKVPMAIVTGSVKPPAIQLIKRLDIEKYFSVILTAEDTKKHKPDPEPFLQAAQLLNLNPESCLVFEDGVAGIQAALSAKMKVIQVIPNKTEPFFKLKAL